MVNRPTRRAESKVRSVDELMREVDLLRSRNDFEGAARELAQALGSQPASSRERLSFELGLLFTYQLRDPSRACPHWKSHTASSARVAMATSCGGRAHRSAVLPVGRSRDCLAARLGGSDRAAGRLRPPGRRPLTHGNQLDSDTRASSKAWVRGEPGTGDSGPADGARPEWNREPADQHHRGFVGRPGRQLARVSGGARQVPASILARTDSGKS